MGTLEEDSAEFSRAARELGVTVARHLIRLRVQVLYGLALLVGDGKAADRCKAWLDDPERQLYPPGED